MKKINRLLAFLLAFTVVITTFSSDLTTAHVYATEAETVIDSEDEIKTVEREEIPVVSEASTEESTEASTEGSTEEAATAADTEENAGEGDENDDAATTGIDGEVVNPEAVVEETAEEEEEEEESEAKTLSAEVNGIKITLNADAGVLPSDAELRVAAIEETDEVEVTEDAVKEAIESEVEEEVTATYSFDINIYSESKGDPDNNGYVQPDTDKGDVTVTFDSIEEAKDENVSLEVFHVEETDGKITNVEPVKSDYATDTADEVTITAEHFSVYTVAVKQRGYEERSISVKLVDQNYHEIANVRNGHINVTGGDQSLANVKSQLPTIGGYTLLGISARKNGGFGESDKYYEVKKFYLGKVVSFDRVFFTDSNGTNYQAEGMLKDVDEFFAVYRNDSLKATTSHHIDIGFEKTDFDNYDTHATVSVKIGNAPNAKYQEMSVVRENNLYIDKYDGQTYYEFRLSTNYPISVDQPITFKVEVTGEAAPRYMECSPSKNTEALYRCINAHWSQQNSFGLDYVSNLTQDFKYKTTVNYHSGFDPDTIVDSDTPEWTTQNENETTTTYTVKSTYPAGKAKKQNHDFDGWALKVNGKLEKITTTTITVSKNASTEIYALWKPKLIPVAVYATDGTTSANLTDHSADLLKNLRLGWIQDDGYFPIGVVWLDQATVDAGLRGEIGTVINSITSIDTSYLQNAGLENASNTVLANKDKIKLDEGGYAKSYKTAFFRWNNGRQGPNDPEHIEQSGPNIGKTNIRIPDGYTKFAYHLDVRFATSIVKYVGEYYENSSKIASISDKELTRQAYFEGSSIVHPSMDSYKNGYEFVGFYSDQNCTTEFKNTTVADDVTVYAKFKKVVQFNVTYTDGVDNETVFTDQQYTVDKDSDAPAFMVGNKPGIPQWTGYEFVGWKSSVDNKTYKGKLPKVTATVTYTAQWKYGPSEYKVEYYKQNVENEEYSFFNSEVFSRGVKTNDIATYSTDVAKILSRGENRNGFAYVETKANQTGTEFKVVPQGTTVRVRADKQLVIRVYFKRNTYKVTYEYDNQKGKVKGISPINAPVDNTNYRYGQTVTVSTTKVKATGYEFDGWYLGEHPKETFVITKNEELVGKFSPKQKIKYAIKYFQQNIDDDEYTEVSSDERTGNYTENVRFSAEDRYDNRYVGFSYAKTKVLLTGTEPVEYGKNATIPAIAVPAESNTLVIEVYYDRIEYEVTYAYVGDIPSIVDPTAAELVGFTKKYRYQQFVTLEDDAEAPGYTFNGWKARPVVNGEELTQTATENTSEAPKSIPAFLVFFHKVLFGEDGSVSRDNATSFKMPASNVCVEGSFTKSPYQIVLKLKGNAEDEGFNYVTTYNGTPQSAPIDFTLEVYMEGSSEPLTALNVNSENYDTLMASIDKVMSLGTLTVYAASDDLFENLDPEETTYTGEEQSAKTVSKSESVTIDGRKYTVTVEVGCSEETDAGIYDITVKSISFKLGDKPVSDLFETDIKAGDKIGTFTIQQAPLKHKADDKYKAYGASDPELTASIIGLVGKDAPNKEKVEDFYKKYIYKIERDDGESAGGKYPIHVYLKGGVETELPQQEVLPVEQLLLAEAQPEIFTVDDDIASVFKNYKHETEDGILTIGPAGGGDDEEYVPRDPDADSPVAAAPAPAVLGIQRELPGEAPAVLGARRAGTSDTSVLGSIITIIVAAAIAFSMVFIKRRKREEN